MQVDVPGFEAEMAAQRARSKDAREEIDLTAQGMLNSLAGSLGQTEFVGYESLHGTAQVKALLVDEQQVQEAGPGRAGRLLARDLAAKGMHLQVHILLLARQSLWATSLFMARPKSSHAGVNSNSSVLIFCQKASAVSR